MSPRAPPARILFMYLGRHGALGTFVANLADAAGANPAIEAHFVVSNSGQLLQALSAKPVNAHAISTFERTNAVSLVTGFLRARAQLGQILRRLQPLAVVNLMPHVFTPLLGATVRRSGAVFLPIIHDATPHPGDPTARLTRWLIRDVRNATRILTLSRSVANTLVNEGYAQAGDIDVLFHPDILPAIYCPRRERLSGTPFRILFFGRIMAYKGLSTFVAATEKMRARGVDVEVGVAGSGEIADDLHARLNALGARIENRWIANEEVAPLFADYHAMACPHLEASQSGVAALALGHGLPVVAMPTGGIGEQIEDGVTGILARTPDSAGFAAAAEMLASDSGLYQRIVDQILSSREERSPSRFISRLAEIVSTIHQVHKTTR